MHSSRMRTVRLLTITHSIWGEGGVCPGGSAWGVSAWGVSAWGVCNGADTPHKNRITDRYKNITLPLTSFAGGNKCSNLKYHTKQLEGKKQQKLTGMFHLTRLVTIVSAIMRNSILQCSFV